MFLTGVFNNMTWKTFALRNSYLEITYFYIQWGVPTTLFSVATGMQNVFSGLWVLVSMEICLWLVGGLCNWPAVCNPCFNHGPCGCTSGSSPRRTFVTRNSTSPFDTSITSKIHDMFPSMPSSSISPTAKHSLRDAQRNNLWSRRKTMLTSSRHGYMFLDMSDM